MVGLKINFYKSEILTIDDSKDWASIYSDIFNCQSGNVGGAHMEYGPTPS